MNDNLILSDEERMRILYTFASASNTVLKIGELCEYLEPMPEKAITAAIDYLKNRRLLFFTGGKGRYSNYGVTVSGYDEWERITSKSKILN